MCECEKKVAAVPSGQTAPQGPRAARPFNRKQAITAFAAQHPDQLKFIRAKVCGTAGTCGLWCDRLVKGPGCQIVSCVDIATGDKIDLMASLPDPAFACPKGLF